MTQLQDIEFETAYVIADADLNHIYFRVDDKTQAINAREAFRKAFPNVHIVIFERTGLTTWEGRFFAKEAKIDLNEEASGIVALKELDYE